MVRALIHDSRLRWALGLIGLLALCLVLTRPYPVHAAPRPVVCIDPGHPSERNSGRAVQNGLREVEVNWTVAQALATELREKEITVVLTKSRVDEYVTNRRRAEIANAAGAALLVRLHCDTGSHRGYALYYPDRQGYTQGRYGPVQRIRVASKAAATRLHAGMAAELKGLLHDGGIRGDSATAVGRKQGALTGSIFSEVPTVTVEMAVLSHAADAAFIRTPEGQARMARALAAGIRHAVQEGR